MGLTPDSAQALFVSAALDLVLLDFVLRGDVDGTSLSVLHQALWPDLPLLFIPAFADCSTSERAKALGPLAYVSKPFTVPGG